jgi:PIN domain nuclease of toxin-antitoxin system
VIVVDTHAWIWWIAEPTRLGKGARRALKAARRIGVPAICCLEVATLAERQRITLDRPILDWLQDALSAPGIELLGLTPAIALRGAQLLPVFPGDPADRLIVATALVESAALVTKDERIEVSGFVRTIW